MNTDYQIWITWDAEKEKILLPVNPETISVSNGSTNETIELAEVGEITIIQGRAAFEYSFGSFFPSKNFSGIIETETQRLKAPLDYIQQIKKFKRSSKPIHLLCTGIGIDKYCTIESLSYNEQGGDVGTIHYDIRFKEYREPTVNTVKVKTSKSKSTKTGSGGNSKSNKNGWHKKGTCTVSNKSGCNIRKTANGKIIGKLKYKQKLEIDGTRSGSWVHIYDSKYGIGYTHKKNLAFDKATKVEAFVDKKKKRVNNSK